MSSSSQSSVSSSSLSSVSSSRSSSLSSSSVSSGPSSSSVSSSIGSSPSSSSISSSSQSSAGTTQATAAVNITNFAFSPGSITVTRGTRITWTNNDTAPHTVTRDGSSGPYSSVLTEGESYSRTFNAVGTFPYHCAIHPEMTGMVTVTP
ncbi:cupredoxin domain-containing protein [Candidatus Peregrinibacteria bacterium]|nr:cupredoxin domain-containing protein [Candidatus Peregrinibacteria bacterium]